MVPDYDARGAGGSLGRQGWQFTSAAGKGTSEGIEVRCRELLLRDQSVAERFESHPFRKSMIAPALPDVCRLMSRGR